MAILNRRASLYLILVGLAVFTSKELFVRFPSQTATITDDPYNVFRIVTTQVESDVSEQRRSLASLGSSKRVSQHAPLSCRNIFYEDRNKPKLATSSDPNQGGMYARFTTTQPAFWVALHHPKYDSTRWSIMTHGKYYESILTDAFVNVIHENSQQQQSQQNPTASRLQPLHVIDVGGNIGWYTMLSIAAALEQNRSILVDVFDPNPRNHVRLCESLHLNDWLSHDGVAVHLYALGVTSESMANATRMGRMDISQSGIGSLESLNNTNITGTVQFPLITLDQMAKELDWINPSDHEISIFKVDVEGFELDVMEGAQQLLKSHRIRNIFLEGNVEKEHGDKFRRLVKVLVNCGYAAYKIGGYKGPRELVESNWTASDTFVASAEVNRNHLLLYTTSLMKQCQGNNKATAKKRNICNMWWRPF